MANLNIAMQVAGAVIGDKEEQQQGQSDRLPAQQQQQMFNPALEEIKRRQAQQMQCDL
jgi:hypothetical protein